MDVTDRIKLASLTWTACEKHLPPELAGALSVMGRDPTKFDKLSPNAARLRVRPRKKIPANFWGGWTWYELHVGFVPIARPEGLNIGGFSFIHSANQKGSGAGAYARPATAVLQDAVSRLGGDFYVHATDNGKILSLGRVYGQASFPFEEAGQDFARLIAETLPLLQQIPSAVSKPKNRAEWWAAKLARNRARDLLVTRTLRKAGWRVVRVWECDLAKQKNWPRVARRVTKALQTGEGRRLATD